jgi:6-phosphogluconolactonase
MNPPVKKVIGSTSVFIHETAEDVAKAVAQIFCDSSSSAIMSRNRFSVALAGGSTPRQIYRLLATPPFVDLVDWNRVTFFFGDERTVPPDNSDSNYKMAREALFDHLRLTGDQICRIHGEAPPDEAALTYESELKDFFSGCDWPTFDLVLLGMGEDGHTASLFPGSPALEERKRWVVANNVSKLNTVRITLTLPALIHARRIVFIVTGSNKTAALKAALNPASGPDKLPSAEVQPADGVLEWHVDRAAAAGL